MGNFLRSLVLEINYIISSSLSSLTVNDFQYNLISGAVVVE